MLNQQSTEIDRSKSVRARLVKMLALARDLRPTQYAGFAESLTKLLEALKTESPNSPARRFLDCLRQAERASNSEHSFPTSALLVPTTNALGLSGYVLCAYLSGLPGFEPINEQSFARHLEVNKIGNLQTGFNRLQRMIDLPEIEATFIYDNPEWRVATLLVAEDLLHRLTFDSSFASKRGLSETEHKDLVAKVYKACANSRGILSGSNERGIFERFLRDSAPFLKRLDPQWLQCVKRFSALYKLVDRHSLEEFSRDVSNFLCSGVLHQRSFAIALYAAGVVPMNLATSKVLCAIISTGSHLSRDATQALKTGDFADDNSRQSTIAIVESRLDDLSSRKSKTPNIQLAYERFAAIRRSLNEAVELDDTLGDDYTSAP